MTLKYMAGALALAGCLTARAEMVLIEFSGSVVMPGSSGIAVSTSLQGEGVLNMGDYSAATVRFENVVSDPVFASYGVNRIRHVEFAASNANRLGVAVGGRIFVAIDPVVRITEYLRTDGVVTSNTVYLESRAWSAAQGDFLVPMSLQLSNVATGQALQAAMLERLTGFGSLGAGAIDPSQGFVPPVGFLFRVSEASVLASAVPEPGKALLGALGGLAIFAARRRKPA